MEFSTGHCDAYHWRPAHNLICFRGMEALTYTTDASSVPYYPDRDQDQEYIYLALSSNSCQSSLV